MSPRREQKQHIPYRAAGKAKRSATKKGREVSLSSQREQTKYFQAPGICFLRPQKDPDFTDPDEAKRTAEVPVSHRAVKKAAAFPYRRRTASFLIGGCDVTSTGLISQKYKVSIEFYIIPFLQQDAPEFSFSLMRCASDKPPLPYLPPMKSKTARPVPRCRSA